MCWSVVRRVSLMDSKEPQPVETSCSPEVTTSHRAHGHTCKTTDKFIAQSILTTVKLQQCTDKTTGRDALTPVRGLGGFNPRPVRCCAGNRSPWERRSWLPGNQLSQPVCSAWMFHHLAVSDFACCARESCVCSGVRLEFSLLRCLVEHCRNLFPSNPCLDATQQTPDYRSHWALMLSFLAHPCMDERQWLWTLEIIDFHWYRS